MSISHLGSVFVNSDVPGDLYNWFDDTSFFSHSSEIYFSPLLDLKKKLDGYCISGSKNETEVYAISYQLFCHLVSLITVVISSFELYIIYVHM